MNSSTTNDFNKYKELVNEIKIAALITFSDQDGLKGRPMSTAEVDDEGNLWFFTNEFSEKVEDITRDNQVILSYASRADNSYMMVKGKSELINDTNKMKSLWNPILKIWFPEGLNDPKIMLLKIQPDEIEFWDGNASKIVIAFKMLKAFITGKEFNGGEHKKINVNQE